MDSGGCLFWFVVGFAIFVGITLVAIGRKVDLIGEKHGIPIEGKR